MKLQSITTAATYVPWLVKEILVAGVTLAAAAFKKDNGYHPVILRYPLRVTDAWDIFWFTSSITATPGTLSLGLREPIAEGLPRIVLVHAVQGDDPADVVASLADMEERLAPHVKDIDWGVPGQGPTEELDPAYYEYPLETIGRHMRAPDLVETEDTALAETDAEKFSVWPLHLPGAHPAGPGPRKARGEE
ncbi:monovalent cation/H+ antiporter subunit E [uncultured Corynebacterium sp.]|uniref:monovalent cation/H+ antiporter subunit E n=1 Tax=uncultured Corynebacterium sp. TaxID=159447 RepID=UPI0025E4D444|nr:monovalent cation/H+ antiporter subunit E [uncultured Corynebacterium sp.]